MQTSSAAEEPNGTIIAGTGSHEKSFYAPRSALEKSPVIKGWIEDRESIPPSLLKGGALYFPECDPEVVHAVIEDLKSATDGPIAIPDPSTSGSKDVLFYVKMYKFALCLGLNELCVASLRSINELTHDTKTFLRILSVSAEEKTSLVDDRRFRDWMVGYMARESNVLKESNLFKDAIMGDSWLAWRLCSLLISSLGGMGNGTGDHCKPISTSSPPRTPPNKASSETTPERERRKSPYLYRPQQKSPSPRQDINRIKKPQKDGVRKLSATVEDVIDREYLSPKREPDN